MRRGAPSPDEADLKEEGVAEWKVENCSDSRMNKLKNSLIVNCLSLVTNDLIGERPGFPTHPSQ